MYFCRCCCFDLLLALERQLPLRPTTSLFVSCVLQGLASQGSYRGTIALSIHRKIDLRRREECYTVCAALSGPWSLQTMEDKNGIDVLVIGGGLAVLATSIHLARAGLSVTCVQSDEFRLDLVGESLDWSAPDLLKGIGVPVDMLMQ